MTGSPQNTPRADTTPLQRDNTRVHEERTATAADFASGDTTGVPNDAARPAFQQPQEANPQVYGQVPGGNGGQPSANQQTGAQPGGGFSSGPHSNPNGQPGAQPVQQAHPQQQYAQAHQQPQFAQHPGQQTAQPHPTVQQGAGQPGPWDQAPAQQTSWEQGAAQQGSWDQGAGQQQAYAYQQQPQQPAAAAQRPHNPTNRQQPVRPERPARSSKITPSGWLMRGLVLLGVSLISGLVWALVKPDDPADQAQPPPQEQGKYQFQPVLREEGFQGCADVSTRKIKEYFRQHQCEHLTRALYTATLPDGQQVLTSLATVRMPDAASAAQLNSLVSADDTGNIMDLVSAGRDLPGNFPKLSNDLGYFSSQQDRLVVVGESGYFGKSSEYEDGRLGEITRDALRLGWPQDGSG